MYRGRVHRFGDNINTDDIIAGKYKHATTDVDALADHIMENIRPGFRAQVRPDDFLVAGLNFGCGSSREQAPQIIRHVGIRAVLARSFARIFFRNAINIGLLVVTCDTSAIGEGDVLQYSVADRTVKIVGRGITLTAAAIPEAFTAIVEAGGLIPYVRQKGTL
jgi:3-isopropylmalate/(R)-2-methylmalate dehydratase small subunit